MTINVGMISFAHSTHPQRYLAALQRHSEVNLVGVWDDEPARAKAHTDPVGVEFYESLDRLLTKCDAVVISSRYDQHRKHLRAASAHGLSVLCEKPLTHSERELQGLLGDLTDLDRQRVMIALPCRYIPGMQYARDLYRNGDLGELVSINVTNRGACPESWFIDSARSGGGAIMDHTAHAYDLIRWMTGEDADSAHVFGGSNVHGRSIEDSFMMQLRLTGGAIAVLDGSWTRQDPLPSTFDVTIRIVGTAATVEVNALDGRVSTYGESVSWDVYTGSIDDAMIGDFIGWAISGASDPAPIPFDAGVYATQLSFDAYRSLSTGSVVRT